MVSANIVNFYWLIYIFSIIHNDVSKIQQALAISQPINFFSRERTTEMDLGDDNLLKKICGEFKAKSPHSQL